MSEDDPAWKALTGRTNPLAHHAKTKPEALITVISLFCHGGSVALAGKKSGLTPKSTRALYLQLRDDLLADDFAPWHRANRILLEINSPNLQEAIREAFFEAMAACHANRSCQRNFDTAKRKSRLCRACPLPGRFSSPDQTRETLELIDTVRAFYKRTGIGAERAYPPRDLFKRRAVHTATLIAALDATRKTPTGLPDHTHDAPLTCRRLMRTLILKRLQ